MPIISITQEMLNHGREPEPGWSPAKLSKSSENKAREGKSTNYFFEFECQGGPENAETNKGRYVTFMITGGGLAAGITAEISKLVTMYAALRAIPINEVQPDTIDTKKLEGEACWIKIEPEIDQKGTKALRVTDFSANGSIPF